MNGSAEDAHETVTPAPSTPFIAVSVPAGPAAAAQHLLDYDPCFDLEDEAVVRAGFAPETRQRADVVSADRISVGCRFLKTGDTERQLVDVKSAVVRATDYAYNEVRDRENARREQLELLFTDVDVRGAPAIVYRVLNSIDCTFYVFAERATWEIVHEGYPEDFDDDEDPCGQIKITASIVDDYLDGS